MNHVLRAQNTVADHLANVAMDNPTDHTPVIPHIDEVQYGSLVLEEQGYVQSTTILRNTAPMRTAKEFRDCINQSKEHLARIKKSQLVLMFLSYGLKQFANQFTSQSNKEAGIWLQWYGHHYCGFGYESQALKNFGQLLRVRCCLPSSEVYDTSGDQRFFKRICRCFSKCPTTYSHDVFHIMGCPENSIIRIRRHDQIVSLLASLMRQQARLALTDGRSRIFRIDPDSISTEEAYGRPTSNGYYNKSDISVTVFNKRLNCSERLTLDVMVVNPTSKKYLQYQPPVPLQNFASELGRKHKLTKYADAAGVEVADLASTVIPLMWETTGRVHPLTKKFLDSLFEDTYTSSTLRRRLYTSVSSIIQRHNGNLLAREYGSTSRFIKY